MRRGDLMYQSDGAFFGGSKNSSCCMFALPGTATLSCYPTDVLTLCLLGTVSNSRLSRRRRFNCSVVSYETSSSICTASLRGTPYTRATLGSMPPLSADGWYPIVRGLLDIRHCRQAAARWKVRNDV
ncbi:hypothetical protein F5Y05DRAFT_370132, partial [Hypoxylon sp. FL0543]